MLLVLAFIMVIRFFDPFILLPVDERRKLSVGNVLQWFMFHASLQFPMVTALPIGVAHETRLHLLPSCRSRNEK